MLSFLFWLFHDALFFFGVVAGHGSFPKPLSREEEQKALAAMREGDAEARQKLIEHNLRLVSHIARKYTVPGFTSEDLVSVGALGLVKAVETFKADSGTQLSSYAARCIENEILMLLRASPKRRGDVSLSEALDADGEGSGLMLMDVVATEEDLADQIGSRELCESLRTGLERCLDAREARIIRLRYGLGGTKPLTQLETAEKCGISRSYVSRLEKRALEKLRHALEEESGPAR